MCGGKYVNTCFAFEMSCYLLGLSLGPDSGSARGSDLLACLICVLSENPLPCLFGAAQALPFDNLLTVSLKTKWHDNEIAVMLPDLCWHLQKVRCSSQTPLASFA